MSLSTVPEVDAYYLDSTFGARNATVTHHSAGHDGTGCRGTWKTLRKLEGERGSGSCVEVQTLLLGDVDGNPAKGGQPLHAPSVMRAVKRLRMKESYPEVDHWPMIERGILCLARANVSDTIAVVRMLGWYTNTQQRFTYIAMEYYPHGNLRDFLRDAAPQEESWAREVMKQVLGVLAELVAGGLAHRNIKPANILIASTLPIRIKVGDFHNAKWSIENNGLHTQVGILQYIAPEMRRRADTPDAYTTKIDMWALGIILHEILTLAHPFCLPGRKEFSESVYERFMENTAPVVLAPEMARSSAHARKVVAALLDRNPLGRPNPAEALAMPWFVLPAGEI